MMADMESNAPMIIISPKENCTYLDLCKAATILSSFGFKV